MSDRIRATVLTGGHPFVEDAFEAMLGGLNRFAPISTTHLRWPDAEGVFEEGRLDATDVLVLYDMQGVAFTRDGRPPALPAPSPMVVSGWERLLSRGLPVVALHHAIAAWPAWPRYADIVGGRFHYVEADLRGTHWPDSGYRHDVDQQLSVVDPAHPVCAGLPPTFRLVDETYLCPVFEDAVTPLLVSDAPKTDDEFYGATLAVTGNLYSREGWSHPPGSNLAAWTHKVQESQIVYIQPGDGPGAFGDPNYRRLLANAITWVTGSR